MTGYQMYINDQDSAALTREQLQLARQATGRVAALLGPAPVGGHAVAKGGSGPCRICGTTAKLTFEHVPPQSSGNVHRRRAIDLATDLSSPLGQMPKSGWVSMQKGSGAYATCAACNSFGGTKYVPAYSDAVAAAVIGLQQWAGASDAAGQTGAPEFLRLKAQRAFRPGAVIRQALFMLMAMSGSAGLGTQHPMLRRIVLDGERLKLPAAIVVRLSLVISSRVRVNPVMAEIRLSEMTERAVLEVAHTPFAWLTEIGPRSDRTAPDVSNWTEFDPVDEIEVDLKLPVGSLVTAQPADYRHYWQIPQDPAAQNAEPTSP
jgi:hypothetical protein